MWQRQGRKSNKLRAEDAPLIAMEEMEKTVRRAMVTTRLNEERPQSQQRVPPQPVALPPAGGEDDMASIAISTTQSAHKGHDWRVDDALLMELQPRHHGVAKAERPGRAGQHGRLREVLTCSPVDGASHI